MVQVLLHKMSEEGLEKLRNAKCPPAKGTEKSLLAVGRTFKFRSGRAYQVQGTGALVRVDRKPWKNKGERKRYLRARRLERSTS